MLICLDSAESGAMLDAKKDDHQHGKSRQKKNIAYGAALFFLGKGRSIAATCARKERLTMPSTLWRNGWIRLKRKSGANVVIRHFRQS
jgi:hypothetical protein